MAALPCLFSLFLLQLRSLSTATPPSLYLSSATLSRNYENMVNTFKVFIYPTTTKPVEFSDASVSLFYETLRRSPFLTADPATAHLFFVPFSDDTSARNLGRVVREIRNGFPFWNRTLGSDHFFLSPAGIGFSSDRNGLELKKNSIQVSVFPVVSGDFIPHKDVALPPIGAFVGLSPEKNSRLFLGYLNWNGKTDSDLVRDLKEEEGFLVEEKSEALNYSHRARESKFCLFLYHGSDLTGIAMAMAAGCVPVVIVNRPIQDLPLMDVLRWSDFALFIPAGRHGGAERLKEVLNGVSDEKYLQMRDLSTAAASTHLRWNAAAAPQPFDAFHMAMYQLWLRRHAVRYARRDAL